MNGYDPVCIVPPNTFKDYTHVGKAVYLRNDVDNANPARTFCGWNDNEN